MILPPCVTSFKSSRPASFHLLKLPIDTPGGQFKISIIEVKGERGEETASLPIIVPQFTHDCNDWMTYVHLHLQIIPK
ncbi:hypothetical protein FKM82_017997 [Ascaphus truei]